MNISYRTEITNKDIPGLNALLNSIGGNRSNEVWEKVIEKSSLIVVAEVNNQIVGMGRFVNDGAMCMIYDIFTNPKFQNKKIATNVLERLTSKINKDELVFVGLFASEEHKFIKELYRKFGFKNETSGMRLS